MIINNLFSTVRYIQENILPDARVISRIVISGRPIYIILESKNQKYYVNYNNRWYDHFGIRFLHKPEKGTSYKRKILDEALKENAIMMSGFPPQDIYEIYANEVYSFAREYNTIYTPSTEKDEEVGVPYSKLHRLER